MVLVSVALIGVPYGLAAVLVGVPLTAADSEHLLVFVCACLPLSILFGEMFLLPFSAFSKWVFF